MNIFKSEETISDLIKSNKTTSEINYLVGLDKNKGEELATACQGNACALSALKEKNYKITDDIMPISSILVTDIWNANNDVFTAEEIVKAYETPEFKPINWMHRGSEDTENENIGVMVKSKLVYGGLPEINYMTDEEAGVFNTEGNTLSGNVHIKQDGIIWSQYFPTYASKIKNGIGEGKIYVSMECFFEDFGYCLRKNEDDENPLFIDRTDATSHISKDLTSYGGSGKTKYKGKKYQVGRWLKNIIFSGQGIVFEPANKRKGKILSIIIKDENKSKADVIGFDPAAANPPTAPVQAPNTILNPLETQTTNTLNPSLVSTPLELSKNLNMPKTSVDPADGLLFYTAKEAEKVGEIEMGCTGHHLYQEDRHSDNPLLYAKLIADPSDLEDQMKVARYRPCDDERELRFVLEDMAKKGLSLRRGGLISPSQTTSFQPSVPGGGGENTGGVMTSDTTTGQPGGTDMGQAQSQDNTSINNSLSDNYKKVYENKREAKLEKITEEEIEQVMDLATGKISELSAENLEYEKAIAEATEYIEKLNSQIKELQAFAAEVEEIADKANAQKTVAKRKTELESIVGLDLLDISDKDIEAMNEASYAILKKSMAKTASAIDKAAEDLEKAKAASVAISHKPRQTSAPMVVSSEVIETKKNSAEALIGFAFSKKR